MRLKRLEYRGYDSAGVATIKDGKLDRRRAEGKLANLDRKLGEEPLAGHVGIGHTRWATHGAPTEANAHPHFCNGVAVVHNGIIENFAPLRSELIANGAEFHSQTDTEVVAQLLAAYRKNGLAAREAMQQTLSRLEGAYALAVLFEDQPDMILGARSGPPLAVGHGEGEMFLGSDAIALAPFTDKITYLEDGDWVVVTHDHHEIYDQSGQRVERRSQISQGAAYVVDKGNHRHFMEKEIYEQSEVVSHTLSHYIDFAEGRVKFESSQIDFADLDRLAMSACGTAYYAGLVGKYWFERFAPAAGGNRCRFRIPLPGNAADGSDGRFVHLAIGRDRRHIGVAPLLPRAQADHRRRGQCARIHHRAGIGRGVSNALPARKSASPRPRRSPVSFRCSQHLP